MQIQSHINSLSPAPAGLPDRRREHVHLNYLDSLRALAAVFVVLHHAWLQVWPVDYGHLPGGWTWRMTAWLLYGHFAVDLFIVLSGFSLMLPIVRGDGTLRGGAWSFLKKRARRILPPYYLAMGFSLLLAVTLIARKTGTHWDMSVPVTWHGILIHLLLLQDVFANGQINHAFWSISVEWRIYFFFPLLVWGWRRWGASVTTLTAIAAPYLLLLTLRHSPASRWVGECPWYLGLFALGMLGAAVAFSERQPWPRLRQVFPWGVFAGAVGALTALLCWHWGWQTAFYRFKYLDLAVGIASLSLLVSVSGTPGSRVRQLLDWKPLVFVGTFAYSLYLIHAPLLQVVWQYLIHPLNLSPLPTFLGLALIGTPLIAGASYVFFLVCERPFLTARRHPTFPENARDAALSPAP